MARSTAIQLLRHQVDEYLEQARTRCARRPGRQQQGVLPHRSGGCSTSARSLAARQRITGTPSGFRPQQDLRALNSLRPSDRRRASRRRAADLAGQWGVRLSPDGDASIVDISCSGVRLETSTRLHPGLIDLEVIGMEGSVAVGARLIRTETVDADGPEVKYRVAAMFLREIDLFATNANPILVAAAAARPTRQEVLADLLGRVLADATWVSNGAALWSSFESEVCALVRARRSSHPRGAGAGRRRCQSLYFRIPSDRRAEHGLHIVFERGYRPTAAEFRLLKAAASLASVVLDLAPAGETASITSSQTNFERASVGPGSLTS